MALSHPISLPIGISVESAYTRITQLNYTKDELWVNTETFASAQARVDRLQPVLAQSHSLAWTSSPSLTYCYTELKLLPEFVGAADV